jgi:hypothetical protein
MGPKNPLQKNDPYHIHLGSAFVVTLHTTFWDIYHSLSPLITCCGPVPLSFNTVHLICLHFRHTHSSHPRIHQSPCAQVQIRYTFYNKTVSYLSFKLSF